SEAIENRLADLFRGLTTGKNARDAEVVTKYLKKIQEEAFRCKEITERLLEFSRGGEPHREPTDLGELIQSVLDQQQFLPRCKGKHIVFPAPGSVVAWVNSLEIKSVVTNLVVNALDSMEPGGTLTVTLRPGTGLRERSVDLVFADTGCGMKPE